MWLLTEDRGEIRWLTLSRPDRKNAIPATGWDDLRHAFNQFENSSQRVLIVTGAGGEFCSGADLDPAEESGSKSIFDRHQQMKKVGAATIALSQISKPTIAAVDGVAVGAGMNLAIGCDLVVTTNRARFSEIFVRRGLTLDFGGSWLLPRLVGMQRAKEMALTGRLVGGEEAARIGLALQAVEPEQLEETVAALAEDLLKGAPVGQMLTKGVLQRSGELTLESAISWEGQNQSICFATEDFNEGISSFLEKRSPRWQGK